MTADLAGVITASYPRRVFKALLCLALFFIAVGAVTMRIIDQRRGK